MPPATGGGSMLLNVAIRPPMRAPCAAPLAVAAATSTWGGCRRTHCSTSRFFCSMNSIWRRREKWAPRGTLSLSHCYTSIGSVSVKAHYQSLEAG